MTTNQITKQESQPLATTNDIAEMFGQSTLQLPIGAPLPQARIMRESPQFEMPDGSFQKELTGHIIYYTNSNAYYSAAFGEGDTSIPDCFSSNGISPDGGSNQQSKFCRECLLNQFGSGNDKRAKACINLIRLYLLLDGDILPTLIKAPPSSLGKRDSLMRWLTSAPNIASKAGVGTAYQPIKVKCKLVRKDFESGFSASILNLETIRVLNIKDPADMAEIRKLAALTRQFKENYLGRIASDIAAEKNDQSTDSNTEQIPV
ncbi:MAG: hypothetical protein BWY69_00726 [Planctomycetes bacterium ADurb.Bin401]|nr:MAG: hypothetical protein BWY69_00726 [Planctomycetes bacterium ADurb.Bin401]